jgi:hypothetical protein
MAERTLDDTSFDFWVGTWITSWEDANGRSHKGSNVVLKLDGRVRELFEGPSRPRRYVGTSVSEWDVGASVWEQEYWDNTGYHAFFRGGWRGDRFILDQVQKKGSSEALRRLVWHLIEADSMLWDYEMSKDGGQTWVSTWHIAYLRSEHPVTAST